jgi:hypothetical protein
MRVHPGRLLVGLIGVQIADAVVCAVPNGVVQQDLDRMQVPEEVRRAIPVLKAASAVGLTIGLWRPRLGRLTAGALVAYFVAALGAHARVRDPAWRYVAAFGMLGWATRAERAYRSTP